ncbi:MAG: hypothetical protein WA919_16655 [Coleofasciculaceae cyanobacterium]
MRSKILKQARWLLLGTVIASIGLQAAPVKAQISTAKVEALVEALRQAAPPNTPNDNLYSDWQIKPGNIPRWSKQCIGRELSPSDFEASPVTARAILTCVMGDVLQEQYSASGNNEAVAVQRTASWWMTGDAGRYSNPPNSYTRTYIQEVLKLYQQQVKSPQAQSSTPPQPQTSTAQPPSSRPPQTTAQSSTTGPISNAQVAALVEALRQAAPPNTPNDNLYSDWQIKPENIPRWSKQCNNGQELTPRQFEARPLVAREILICVMGDILREQYKAGGNNESMAVRRTASWWMTGDANRYNNSPTNSYTEKVLSFYQQQRSQAQSEPASNSPQETAVNSEQKPTAREPQPAELSAAAARISDTQVTALVEALRLAAPDNTANDNLYSDWQVKPDNIARWSKQCKGEELTPSQFENSPVTARAILVCMMRGVLREQYVAGDEKISTAVQRSAAWWMTGDPNQYKNGSTAEYSQKVLNFYKQYRIPFFSHI